MSSDSGGRIAVHEFEDFLIGSIQVELSDAVAAQFRDDLLDAVHGSGARAVIIDASGLDVMDLHEFEHLRRTFRMAEIMGTRSFLVGLNPGIVAALVTMDADTDGLETALSVEHAIDLLRAEDDSVSEDRINRAAGEDDDVE